jgi:hypothetical protein
MLGLQMRAADRQDSSLETLVFPFLDEIFGSHPSIILFSIRFSKLFEGHGKSYWSLREVLGSARPWFEGPDYDIDPDALCRLSKGTFFVESSRADYTLTLTICRAFFGSQRPTA